MGSCALDLSGSIKGKLAALVSLVMNVMLPQTAENVLIG